MREDIKEPKGLGKDPRVILLIAAVLLSIVFIQPWYSADEGFSTNLNYGLDLEGGSWLQIRLQGAVTQLDGDVEGLADVYLADALGYPVEITGVSGMDMGTAGSTVTFITDPQVTSAVLDGLALGESEISYQGNTSEVVLFTTQEALMTQYLSDSWVRK
jgi:preprotein translocase subunit SecD